MTLRYDFRGRTVVVTGAARGIGLEIARLFHDSGATVALVDADEHALREATHQVPGLALPVDVTDTAAVTAAVDRVAAETGRLDVLVNNAGILRDGVLWKLTDEDYESVLAVHAGGTFRFSRASVPHFRRHSGGRIINVTSYTGLRGNVGQSNYAMAKAGIIGFTKTLAKELARFGVTVNAVSPNAETRMIASIPADKRAVLTATIPLGRFADPAEMAPAVAFLASDEAAYITGVVLPVDGGVSI